MKSMNQKKLGIPQAKEYFHKKAALSQSSRKEETRNL